MSSSFPLTSQGRLGALLSRKLRGGEGARTKPLAKSRHVALAGFAALLLVAMALGFTVAHENWLLLGIAGAGILALLWPVEVALGAYAFLLPFESVTVLSQGSGGGTTVNLLAGALAGAALLGVGIITRRLARPPRAALLAFAFVLWSLATTTWALNSSASYRLFPTAVAAILLYLAAASWRITEKEFSVLLYFIVLGGCVASAYSIYQFSQGVTFSNYLGSTSRGALVVGEHETNPNALGTDLLLPFAIAVSWFFSAKNWRRALIPIAAAGLIIYAVFVTMSRGSLLAVSVVVLVCVWRSPKKKRILAFVPAVAAIVLSMPATFYERIGQSLQDAGSGRLDIWTVGLRLLSHYGVYGAGLGNFGVAYNNFAGYAHIFVGFDRGAHNTYLETGVELGLIGTLLLASAVIWHLRAIRHRSAIGAVAPGNLISAEAAAWGILVAGMFEGISWAKAFWLTWIVCLMAVRIYQAQVAEAPQSVAVTQAENPAFTFGDVIRNGYPN